MVFYLRCQLSFPCHQIFINPSETISRRGALTATASAAFTITNKGLSMLFKQTSVLILCSAFLLGCDDGGTEAENGNLNSFTLIHAGNNPEVSNIRLETITNQQALNEALQADDNFSTDVPDIDFAKTTVVAVYAGEKSTGGYSITVSNVQEYASIVMVDVTTTSPGAGCSTTQSITYPYAVVSFKNTGKPVQFSQHIYVQNCAD